MDRLSCGIIDKMKTIIWDYNGTILDDVDLTYQVEQVMLKERSMKTYTMTEYKDMFCFPVIEYYYKMGYTFIDETYDAVSDEFTRLYDAGFDQCRLADGFTTLIEKAIEMGYRNIIVSAAKQDKLQAQCKTLGIAKYFDVISGTDDLYGGSKIEKANAVMKAYAIDPSQCMYIGDTDHDMDTAEAMGIQHVILTAQGHQSRHILEKKCANVVDSLKEICL